MMLSWAIYVVVVSALLGVAALVAEHGLRLVRLPTRAAWAAALTGVVVLGTLALLPPSIGRPASVADRALLPLVTGPTRATSSAPILGPPLRGRAVQFRTDRNSVVTYFSLVSAAVALSFLLATSLRLVRRRRGWSAEVVDETSLLVTDDVGPAVVGFLRPIIVIPRWALQLPREERALILAHENEHVRAGDQRLLAVTLLLVALVPWNLVLWWYALRLRRAIEMDCDARVLRRFGNVRSYGELLLHVSRRPRALPFAMSAFGESESTLESRIRAMTTPRSRHWSSVATVSSMLAVLVLVVACELPLPSAPPSDASRAQLPARRDNDAFVTDTNKTGDRAPRQKFPPDYIVRAMEISVESAQPQIYRTGVGNGKAVWMALDQNERVLDSWVGPAWSESAHAEWKALRRFPDRWFVPWTYEVKARNGKWIPVVWMAEIREWEWIDGDSRIATRLPEWVRRDVPKVYTDGVRQGSALWYVKDGRNNRLLKAWVAPIPLGRKAQWQYARDELSDHSDLGLNVDRFSVVGADGRMIPVVYVQLYPRS
ncbi:MAG: M56 family metallopeptidase [Gemmatimonadota bacterium]